MTKRASRSVRGHRTVPWSSVASLTVSMTSNHVLAPQLLAPHHSDNFTVLQFCVSVSAAYPYLLSPRWKHLLKVHRPLKIPRWFGLSPQKLVNETFQKMWFTPTPGHRTKAITRKITVITDVVNNHRIVPPPLTASARTPA